MHWLLSPCGHYFCAPIFLVILEIVEGLLFVVWFGTRWFCIWTKENNLLQVYPVPYLPILEHYVILNASLIVCNCKWIITTNGCRLKPPNKFYKIMLRFWTQAGFLLFYHQHLLENIVFSQDEMGYRVAIENKYRQFDPATQPPGCEWLFFQSLIQSKLICLSRGFCSSLFIWLSRHLVI